MTDIITLDSNVFRTQPFINWLMSDQAPHQQHLFPLIAYIEVLIWYEMNGLARSDLDDDLMRLKTKITSLNVDDVNDLLSNVRASPEFPFKHHARDFLIGTLSKKNTSILITYNKRHFGWLSPKLVLSPEEYLKKHMP